MIAGGQAAEPFMPDVLQDISIKALAPEAFAASFPGLTQLLFDCVQAGASVNFVMPFPLEESAAFWRRKVEGPLTGGRLGVWVAEQGQRIVGSVQLDLDRPPNQPHRAEVRKLLVHPDVRRRGVGRALMLALEDFAAGRGRHLLTLDTRSGDAAEPLYLGLGYRPIGQIPGFSRDPFTDRLDATTIMYKTLAPGEAA